MGSSSKLYLFFEYLFTDLSKYMAPYKKIGLKIKLIRSFTQQLLAGLEYLHMHCIFHRDIKPANLLINENLDIKLGDFGLARLFSLPMRPYTHEVVTQWYRAPEILMGTRYYAPSVDIWSLGCIVAEMSIGKALFIGNFLNKIYAH